MTFDTILQKIDNIIVSSQHMGINIEKLRYDIKKEVIKKIISKKYISKNTKYLINPTGRFWIGGSAADTGLTGRKIIVDTYGGIILHGGGAFSGKEYTKVDRSMTINIFENNNDKLNLVYEIINGFFDFTPSNMISELNLKKPIYYKTTTYSHFGKKCLPYEKLDKVIKIKEYLGNL